MAIGINWKEIWKSVWKAVWRQEEVVEEEGPLERVLLASRITQQLELPSRVTTQAQLRSKLPH